MLISGTCRLPRGAADGPKKNRREDADTDAGQALGSQTMSFGRIQTPSARFRWHLVEHRSAFSMRDMGKSSFLTKTRLTDEQHP